MSSAVDMNTRWIAIWDKLVAECIEVTGLDATNVLQGLKFPPVGAPMVMVGPGGYRAIVDDTHGSYYEFNMPIYVFYTDSDITAGYKAAINYAGEIRKRILMSRSLDNTVGEVVDVACDTNPARIPGYERQFVLLTFLAMCWIDDPTP